MGQCGWERHVAVVIIKQVASNKSSLLLKIQYQTQKHYFYLQLSLKWKVYTKVIKMPSWKAWDQRPSGLVKMEGSASTFI